MPQGPVPVPAQIYRTAAESDASGAVAVNLVNYNKLFLRLDDQRKKKKRKKKPVNFSQYSICKKYYF